MRQLSQVSNSQDTVKHSSNEEPLYGTNMEDLDIFISHSSRDKSIAKKLIYLIRSALNIPAENIRCSSVDGFRLPVGVPTIERLRQEVHNSKTFIALITPNSLQSVFVLFELGARWETQKPLMPLLACGIHNENLREPLSAINTLDCGNAAQLHQFIENLGKALNINPTGAAAYQEYIEELTKEANVVAQNHIMEDPKQLTVDDHQNQNMDPTTAILLTIWELDNEIYYEYGYKIEKISEKSGINIQKCKHYLDKLVESKRINSSTVIGNNNGVHYSLTASGRSLLIEKKLVT